MKLHDFISTHADELVEIMASHVRDGSSERIGEDTLAHLHVYVEQVAGALRKADGLPDASPLPGESASAAYLGHEAYRQGSTIGSTAKTLSALCIAVGELGGRHHLAFPAVEYLKFNQAIDDAVATAIEEYAKEDRDQERRTTSKRLGFAAHEFRNAAASAKMAFQMIERGQVGVAGRTADIVRRGFDRMETLAEKMLALGASRPPPALHPLGVGPLLSEIHESAVPERGITVCVHSEPGLSVLGDRDLLTSAISNLVQNAIKFSRTGSEIRVLARAEGETVLIEVEDECGGLPPGKAEDLFEPFVQKSDDRRGAGLGLAITLQAVRQLSGELSVRNLAPRGCAFTVRLVRSPTAPGPPAVRRG